MNAKLDRILDRLEEGDDGEKRFPTDPELAARWAEEERRFEQRVRELQARIREEAEERERRRLRLHRLTFGLLGRA